MESNTAAAAVANGEMRAVQVDGVIQSCSTPSQASPANLAMSDSHAIHKQRFCGRSACCWWCRSCRRHLKDKMAAMAMSEIAAGSGTEVLWGATIDCPAKARSMMK